MNRKQSLNILREWDKKGKYVFNKSELAKLFPNDLPKTLSEGLNRLVKDNLIERACRGVYINQHANSVDLYTIEQIAKTLRYGEYNYISLESSLSEYGVISQMPIDRLTVMTTGRSGVHQTHYGVIEFTHTKRSVADILENTNHIKHRPLRMATKQAAWRDLKRVGRNTHLIDHTELDDEE